MLDVTLYIRPHGKTKTITVQDIDAADAEWFQNHNANVSMEDMGDLEVVVYADIGIVNQGEPEEAIELSRGRSCEETFAALRKQCQRMLGEQVN